MNYDLNINIQPNIITNQDIYQNVEFLQAEAIKNILRRSLFKSKDFNMSKVEMIIEENNTLLLERSETTEVKTHQYIEQVGILTFLRHSLGVKFDEELISKFVKIAERDYGVDQPLDIHILKNPDSNLSSQNIYFVREPTKFRDKVKTSHSIESKIKLGLQDVAKNIRKNLKKDYPPSSADYFEFTAFYDFDASIFGLDDILKSQEYIHMAKDLQKYGLIGIKVPEEFSLK